MISAKIVADSLSPQGHRLTTLEVVMPRYILAEFNTHRVLSKNSASSRAIPFSKMVKNVMDNPFIPYAWQQDHKGMQGNEYLDEVRSEQSKYIWLNARDSAVDVARDLNENEVTKQLANRLLEPFMWHKVLVSGTEWENFFNLRCPQYSIYTETFTEIKGKSWKEILKADGTGDFKDCNILYKLQCNKGQADIHMMFLAEAIYDAINESTPKELKEGEWHIPYGDNMDSNELKMLHNKYYASGYNPDNPMPDSYFTEALDSLMCKISVARCARLSYQTLGDNPEINYEKDLALYETLKNSGHASPLEHVAQVMTSDEYTNYINGKVYTEYGDTINRNEVYGWCRNFRGFKQMRAIQNL